MAQRRSRGCPQPPGAGGGGRGGLPSGPEGAQRSPTPGFWTPGLVSVSCFKPARLCPSWRGPHNLTMQHGSHFPQQHFKTALCLPVFLKFLRDLPRLQHDWFGALCAFRHVTFSQSAVLFPRNSASLRRRPLPDVSAAASVSFSYPTSARYFLLPHFHLSCA